MKEFKNILVLCNKKKNRRYYKYIDQSETVVTICNEIQYLKSSQYLKKLEELIIDYQPMKQSEIYYLICFFRNVNPHLKIIIVGKENLFSKHYQAVKEVYFLNNTKIKNISDETHLEKLNCIEVKRKWWEYILKRKERDWNLE